MQLGASGPARDPSAAHVPVAIVLICFYLFPAIVAPASSLLGWERLDRSRGIALLIALAGMLLACIRRIGGVKAGILILVQAPVGVALTAAFPDESVGALQIAGGVAILAAAVIIQPLQRARIHDRRRRHGLIPGHGDSPG